MYELIYTWIVGVLFGTFLLRKVLVTATALTDNAGSFVNQTADRLHIRKLVIKATPTGSSAIGDAATISVDEVPIGQHDVNDSRSHIGSATMTVVGGTGATGAQTDQEVLTFERGQLFLDPDEAFFINNTDVQGNPNFRGSAQFFYED